MYLLVYFFPVHVKKSYKSELYEQSNKAHIVGANIKHGKWLRHSQLI